MDPNLKTAVLLSGGMDSAALAYWYKPDLALAVDYGQVPAKAELTASRAIAEAIGIEHKIVTSDCKGLGSGDLAGTPALDIAPASDWWPFRNQLLITLAGAILVRMGIQRLLIGSVKTDQFHADGRREFIQAISDLMSLQEGNLKVEAPAIDLRSSELIIQSGIPLEVLGWSHSCHAANLACGRCRGCYKHYEVTQEIGLRPY